MKALILVSALASASFGGYYVSRAAAALPTATLPIYYSGVLVQGGAPIGSSNGRGIVVTLFDSDTGNSPLDCRSTASSVPVSAGHFSVAMSGGDCHSALIAHRAAFVEVKLDGIPIGARQQVGATPFSLVAETADLATTANNVPLAGVTGLAAVITNLKSGPVIRGPTLALADGAGVDQNTGTGRGYSGLAAMCQRDRGSDSFPCTLADATRSLARGLLGPATMATQDWVIGGPRDCNGFSDANAALSGSVLAVQSLGPPPVAFPTTMPCDATRPVLCCAY